MTSPLPAHLAAAIRERIAVLRETWHVDEAHGPWQAGPQDQPATRRRPGHDERPGTAYPTFPSPHRDDARSWSPTFTFLDPHRDDARRSSSLPPTSRDDLRRRSAIFPGANGDDPWNRS
jgi:hypothetical protein